MGAILDRNTDGICGEISQTLAPAFTLSSGGCTALNTWACGWPAFCRQGLPWARAPVRVCARAYAAERFAVTRCVCVENTSSKAQKAPTLLRRLPPILCLGEEEAIRADLGTSSAPKFQVFCGPEWRHLIGREPINHGFSRTPPPIQPLASLFQCVYYTAEHKGRHSSSHALNPLRKPVFSCICKETSKRSTCPRERYVISK